MSKPTKAELLARIEKLEAATKIDSSSIAEAITKAVESVPKPSVLPRVQGAYMDRFRTNDRLWVVNHMGDFRCAFHGDKCGMYRDREKHGPYVRLTPPAQFAPAA